MGLFDSLLAELAGTALGWVAAPAFAAVSALRRARTFHPRGVVYAATVDAPDGPLGEALRGPALVRFSSAWWKGDAELPDALGCALRLRSAEAPSSEAAGDDQDLLFATIRRPFTTPLSPLTTDVHDFLGNDYYAVSPFDVPGAGLAYLRLRPLRASGDVGAPRADRLRAAVARGEAVLVLEVRRAWRWRWREVARVTLRAPVDVDQEAMRFSPFRTGRGLVPRGLVHALRRGVYAMSQAARPSHGMRRAEGDGP
ncbi:MAG: hypothetical protein U0324_22590 [Polyangiales bacterium]